jgi:hypothetical protein
MICGKATTANDRMRVDVKSERVVLERGWRTGGIFVVRLSSDLR